MSAIEYFALVLTPFGFKAVKHFLLAVAIWVFWIGYTAAWAWFFFVYLPSFDVYKVVPVLASVLVAWLMVWAFKVLIFGGAKTPQKNPPPMRDASGHGGMQ